MDAEEEHVGTGEVTGWRGGGRRDRGGHRRAHLLVRKAVGSKVVCTSLKGAMSKITFEKKGQVDHVFGFILAF